MDEYASNIPSDIANAYSVGHIPPDITLATLLQSRDASSKTGIYVVFALSFIFLIFRCYSRIFVVRRFGLDDWLACLTFILYIPLVPLCVLLINNGNGRRSAYVNYVMSLDEDRMNYGELLDIIMHFLYIIALFTCRLSGLAFYRRLSDAHAKLYISIRVCTIVFIFFFIAQFLLLLFHCLPVTGKWPYSWQADYHVYKCMTWGAVYITISCLSFACDVVMFVISSMLIHLLHVPLRRKLELACVMFPGVLALIISGARIVLVCLGQWSTDNTWYYDPQLAVEMSEIGATLIALSVPALKLLFGVYVLTRIRSMLPRVVTSELTLPYRVPRHTFGPWSGNIDDKKDACGKFLLSPPFPSHLLYHLTLFSPHLIFSQVERSHTIREISQTQLNTGKMAKLVYRPCPAELRGSASHPTAQSRISQQTAGNSGHPALCALTPLANQQGFKYVDQYPIDKHAGPMFIHEKQNTFCGICGMCITLEDEQAVSHAVNPFTTTGPDAAQHADAGNEEFEELQQGEDQSIDCDAANERKFGVMPHPGWTGMYRVVVRQTKNHYGKNEAHYYVSGLGRYHLWDSDPKARKMYNRCTYEAKEPVFTVPREKHDLLVDRRQFYNKKLTKKETKNTTQLPPVKRVSVYPRHFHDDENEKFFPHGFPMHDNCWKMAAKIIGADKLEKELNLFIETLQNRFVDEDLFNEGRQVADWIVNERGNFDTWYLANRTEDDVNRILIAMHDPIHVNEIEDLIAESARRYTTMKGKLHDDDASASTTNELDSHESVKSILDELHHSEVEAFLAQTKIVVPWSYWARRAPYDAIWELESIEQYSTPLDWQYLCLRAERLCEESLGIINRSRICNILREVKDSMFETRSDDDLSVVERVSSDGTSTLTANTKSTKKVLVDLTESDWEQDAFMEDN
ncbi:hypothetical protein EYB25_005267 [Talaromyces marneffei]|nr:hypothetical protein EYB25_005267 [Talaromyces marneffei]